MDEGYISREWLKIDDEKVRQAIRRSKIRQAIIQSKEQTEYQYMANVPIEIINAIRSLERGAISLRESAERIPIPEIRDNMLNSAKRFENKSIEMRKSYNLIGHG